MQTTIRFLKKAVKCSKEKACHTTSQQRITVGCPPCCNARDPGFQAAFHRQMPFLFKVSGSWAEEPISPFCLDGFLKHAAFEEGIANQKRLKAPLKQFQRISSLDNNSAVFTAMPKYRTSVTSNVSTQAFFFLQCTLVSRLSQRNAFNSGLIYCYLLKKKKH